MNESVSRSKLSSARTFLVSHRRSTLAVAILVFAVIAFGLVWFQPHKLFVNERLDEPLPEVADPAGTTKGEGDADGQGNGADASNPSDGPVASDESAGPRTLRKGSFRSLEHETTGRISIVRLEDGRRFLRFEDLTTSNGPDLRVYLSEVPASDDWCAYGERFIDLGPLKGNLGNHNYVLHAGTGLSRYRSAVIWCRRFTVGFGVAPLNI